MELETTGFANRSHMNCKRGLQGGQKPVSLTSRMAAPFLIPVSLTGNRHLLNVCSGPDPVLGDRGSSALSRALVTPLPASAFVTIIRGWIGTSTVRAGHNSVFGISQPSTVTESVLTVRRRVIQRQEEAEHSALREKRTETQGRRDSHKYSRRPTGRIHNSWPALAPYRVCGMNERMNESHAH